jgi:hypothetical protein
VGKGRRRGGGRFSRRDALCASALQGLTHAEAFHYTIWVDRWPVARCRHASAKPTHSFRACGARPSGDGQSVGRWPCGETSGQRERRFCRRDALCASARYGRRNGKALRCHRWFCDKLVAETRQHLGLALCLLHGRAEPAPPRRGLADGTRA